MDNIAGAYFLILVGSYLIGNSLYPLLIGEGFRINIPIFGTQFITGMTARMNGLLGIIIGSFALAIPFYTKENRTSLNIILALAVTILNVIIHIYKVKKYKDRPSFTS